MKERKLITGESGLIKSSFNRLSLMETSLAADDDSVTLYPLEIAQLLLNLFWYPKIPKKYLKRNGENRFAVEVSEKYKTGACPRDNSLEGLVNVVSKHIELSLLNFPSIFSDDGIGRSILDSFLSLIGGNGKIKHRTVGWNLSSEEFHSFKDKVDKKLKSYGVTAEDELDASFASSDSGEDSVHDNHAIEEFFTCRALE